MTQLFWEMFGFTFSKTKDQTFKSAKNMHTHIGPAIEAALPILFISGRLPATSSKILDKNLSQLHKLYIFLLLYSNQNYIKTSSTWNPVKNKILSCIWFFAYSRFFNLKIPRILRREFRVAHKSKTIGVKKTNTSFKNKSFSN